MKAMYVYIQFSRAFCITVSWAVGKLKKTIFISKCWQNHYKICNLLHWWQALGLPIPKYNWHFLMLPFQGNRQGLKSVFIKLSINWIVSYLWDFTILIICNQTQLYINPLIIIYHNSEVKSETNRHQFIRAEVSVGRKILAVGPM